MVACGNCGDEGIKMKRAGPLLTIVVVALVALVASGCMGPGPGDDSPVPSSPSPSVDAGALASASPPTFPSPVPSLAPTSATPSMPAVSELEKLLPDYIGGDHVDKRPITGTELLDQGDPPIFDGMLAAVGVGPEAVEGALGTSADVGVAILRVAGVSGADLGDALTDAVEAALPDTSVTEHVIDGQRLRRIAFETPFDDQNLTILTVDDLLVFAGASPAHDSLVDVVLTRMFDPGLKALLPIALDGRPLDQFSVPGIAFPEGGDICSIVCPGEPQRMADELGVDIDGVEIAFAGTDEEPAVSIVAMRFDGAATDALVPAREAIAGRSLFAEKTEHTVAGRTVWRYREPPFGDTTYEEWLYVNDDVLYVIRALPAGADVPPVLELAINALP